MVSHTVYGMHCLNIIYCNSHQTKIPSAETKTLFHPPLYFLLPDLVLLLFVALHPVVLLLVVLGRSGQQRPLEPRGLEHLDALVRELACLTLPEELVLLTLRLDPLPESEVGLVLQRHSRATAVTFLELQEDRVVILPRWVALVVREAVEIPSY